MNIYFEISGYTTNFKLTFLQKQTLSKLKKYILVKFSETHSKIKS